MDDFKIDLFEKIAKKIKQGSNIQINSLSNIEFLKIAFKTNPDRIKFQKEFAKNHSKITIKANIILNI